MTAWRAMASGARRALGSPVMLVWLWLVTLLVTLPAGWIVGRALEQGIGTSLAHETLREGFDMTWYGEFDDEARGMATTFTPTHAGAGAFFDNLESWVDGGLFRQVSTVAVPVAIYALLWLLMLGGVIDRFADRETRPGIRRFFASGGRLFFRLFRLALLSAVPYGVVYWLVLRSTKWLERSTEDVTVESAVLFYTVLVALAAALLLTAIHACFGFAKVATVVDERRSMVFAALRGIAFVVTHPVKTIGLYGGFLLLSASMLGVYALLAPGIAQQSWKSVAWATAWGQLFLLGKMYVRLSLLAGQVTLYQSVQAIREENPESSLDTGNRPR